MKSSEINWNHEADSLSASLGLNDTEKTEVESRVKEIVENNTTVSKAAEILLTEFEGSPAKCTYALLILETTEEGIAMSSFLSLLGEEA